MKFVENIKQDDKAIYLDYFFQKEIVAQLCFSILSIGISIELLNDGNKTKFIFTNHGSINVMP